MLGVNILLGTSGFFLVLPEAFPGSRGRRAGAVRSGGSVSSPAPRPHPPAQPSTVPQLLGPVTHASLPLLCHHPGRFSAFARCFPLGMGTQRIPGHRPEEAESSRTAGGRHVL